MEDDILRASDISHNEYKKIFHKFFDYGTAGFRDKEIYLDFIMYRMGLLAVLKSKDEGGATVGLIITASHNPEEDNGVKLCNGLGEMIDFKWEKYATELINASDTDFSNILRNISKSVDYNVPASVFLGQDTRNSSERLSEAAIVGIKALDGGYRNFGLVTTPQLHYLVVCQNNPIYGEPSIEGYYNKFSDAFEKLRKFKKTESNTKNYEPSVFLDAANGVGAYQMKELNKHLHSLKVEIFNDGSSGALNKKCGADFVKVEQTFPEGADILPNKRYASFDGDADRLIYFYKDDESSFHMLDGDKIAALLATYLLKLVEETGLKLTVRVAQTAYANGKSTTYIENTLNVPVVFVPTGVKHLHHEAKKYDIGIYFEANGHGTVVFSKHAKAEIKLLAENSNTTESKKIMAQKLLVSIDLINEAVGDAIADMLIVETILHDFDWSIQDWDAMYKEYAYRQLKVKVPDRSAVTTTDADRVCVTPVGLQEALNCVVLKVPNSRSFVRASGTEDIVRVYVEAEQQEDVEMLAKEISFLVLQFTTSEQV